MKKQPVLVVMAAGMGSRYGGLKQIDPLGPNGQIILDYSLYDARRAGFERVVFIIKPELEEAFEQAIGRKARAFMQVDYAYQTLETLPEDLTAPEGRVKPLGTGHAVWCAAELIDAPFAVINADDFYGADAFAQIYDFLSRTVDDEKYRYCMVGYPVENTLTENGTVSRGVCTADAEGYLADIVERTKIARESDGVIRFIDGEGGEIAEGTPVSMNLWGFTPSFMSELDGMLHEFFENKLQTDLTKAEFYLPSAVDALIRAGRATAKILTTSARWFGVTYQEDKPTVQAALRKMTEDGTYPAQM
ncbi:MAG: nucleotidyltransferase [Butyricicoccus sp.]|nr:nucleotidyltransferase [Butyricicoccus sp.]MBQ8584927.1 nucleotidyltransferase [Butyricicoccus sp.]